MIIKQNNFIKCEKNTHTIGDVKMRCEIQAHFENGGQLNWFEEIENIEVWIYEKLRQEKCICKDVENHREFYFNPKMMTALIVNEKQESKQVDLYESLYAAKEGEKQESYKPQY